MPRKIETDGPLVTAPIAPGMTRNDVERILIFITLARFSGNRRRTAAAIGMSLRNLQYRLLLYGAEDKWIA